MHQAADVVGVAVGNDNHIHLLRRISCSHDKVPKVACRGYAPLSVALAKDPGQESPLAKPNAGSGSPLSKPQK